MQIRSYKALLKTVPFFIVSLWLHTTECYADNDVRAVTKPDVNRFTPLSSSDSSVLTLSPAGCVQKTETVSLSGMMLKQYTGWLLKSKDNWLVLSTSKVSEKQLLLHLPQTQLTAGVSYPLYSVDGDNKVDTGLNVSICPAFTQLPLLPPADLKTD